MGLLKLMESTQLEIGTQVEMEHTDDPKEARKIAMDHIKEDPLYYTKLSKAGLIDEPKALELVNEYSDEMDDEEDEEGMSIFDALMTDENAEYIIGLFGCDRYHWVKSSQSESVYLYMRGYPPNPSATFKIRFSGHDDKHFSPDESLGTIRIQDCVRHEGIGLSTDRGQLMEDVWSPSLQSVKYTFNTQIVNRFKKRMEQIIEDYYMEDE